MTIQDWGALGELVGAIAVVASLVYLAIQIRQNTRQISQSMESTRLAAFERNIEAGNRIRELILLNPEVGQLLTRGMEDYDGLSRSDKMNFDLLLRNIFASFQGGYVRQLTLGSDPEDFEGTLRTVDGLLAHPGVRQWLAVTEPDWRPEFTELVRERLQRHA
jgi:hypothetical protein